MKKIFTIIFVFISALCYGQLPIGTQRNPIYTDVSGNVINTPITLSNQWSMIPAPTTAFHLVRYQDLTNAMAAGFPIVPIAKGGTGTNTTLLVGSWTNTGNFTAATFNGLSSPTFATNFTTPIPWLVITGQGSNVLTIDTNATKIAINTYTDNNASGLTNFPSGLTNVFVTASVTNGLASLGFVTSQGYVTQTVTNGLASISFVQSATNGLVTATITNGLASISYVDFQDGARVATNDMVYLSSLTNIVNTIPWQTITGQGTRTLTIATNTTLIPIAAATDNNAGSLTNFPAGLTNSFLDTVGGVASNLTVNGAFFHSTTKIANSTSNLLTGSFVTLSNLTISLPAGSYYVRFNAEVYCSVVNTEVQCGIFTNSVLVAGTTRRAGDIDTTSTIISTMDYLTLPETTTVSIQGRTTAGTGAVSNKCFIISRD